MQTSLDDVFRFIRLGAAIGPQFEATFQRTQFFITLEHSTEEVRRRIATTILGGTSTEVVRRIEELGLGATIQRALITVLASDDHTCGALVAALPPDVQHAPEFLTDLNRLSDTILLSYFARDQAPAALDELCRLYIAYLVVLAVATNPELAAASLRKVVYQSLRPPFVKPPGKAVVRSVGVANLLVVKQHIKRYEASEIGHIENVMPGETRSREHRQLERFEEMITNETETTSEKEEELTSTERFEMEREASRTIKEDQKYSFDLSVSGQFGPVVEFQTGLGIEVTRSEETQQRDATKYARDVVQRSLERVKERVREERIRRITRETEERNLHSFTNTGERGFSGIYQFVDKVYEAQVFNYGKRQMFDLMIPEPASYLWYLERMVGAASADFPPPPPALETAPLSIEYAASDEGHPAHYATLAALYRATTVEPPPPMIRGATAKLLAPLSTTDGLAASEHGDRLAPPTIFEVEIPAGYLPRSAVIQALALTDNVDRLHVSFTMTGASEPRTLDTSDRTHVGGNPVDGQIYVVRGGARFDIPLVSDGEGPEYATESKLHVGVFAFETANHAITCDVEFVRTKQALTQWKLETYEKILAAYQARLTEHRDEVNRIKAELRSQASSDERKLGLPPTVRGQTIVTELKKSCIAMLRQQWFTDASPMNPTTSGPPTFDLVRAQEWGRVVRFIEHAFQWDQLQYAFYPYFWARSTEWESRFNKQDPDYDYQQFLQAGSARVVFAVRPGFELAVSHFLETGEVWRGAGEPTIDDPLYRSIVDEIRDRADAGMDAIPDGEPWELRLPTSLVLLRPMDERPSLPQWQRAADGTWTWSPLTFGS